MLFIFELPIKILFCCLINQASCGEVGQSAEKCNGKWRGSLSAMCQQVWDFEDCSTRMWYLRKGMSPQWCYLIIYITFMYMYYISLHHNMASNGKYWYRLLACMKYWLKILRFQQNRHFKCNITRIFEYFR